MIRIGAYEAKTRFSELITRAEKGEEFEITKNGRPVARICPGENDRRKEAGAAAQRIRERLGRQTLAQTDPVPPWEELKAEREAEDDARADRWTS